MKAINLNRSKILLHRSGDGSKICHCGTPELDLQQVLEKQGFNAILITAMTLIDVFFSQ